MAAIGVTTQTIAIIRLNAMRMWKSGWKWFLLFMLAFTFLPYALTKAFALPGSKSTPVTYPVSPAPVLLDLSVLDAAQQSAFSQRVTLPGLKQSSRDYFTTNYGAVNTTSMTYQKGILITPTVFDTTNSRYAYTITTIDQVYDVSFSSLWQCISASKSCSFNPIDLDYVAYVKFLIDSALTPPSASQSLSILKVSVPFTVTKKSVKLFQDLFFYALGIMVTTLLIEEKTKGLKFGLLMTGVRRSAYYIGVLFVPFLIATLWALVVLLMMVDLWESPSATGPLVLFVFCGAYGYLGYSLLLSQIVSDARYAQLGTTLFVIGGYVADQFGSDMVAKLPSSLILILCINPRIALTIYTYTSQITTSNGFSSVNIPFSAPSTNQLIGAAVGWNVFLYAIAIYLDWLQISKDERRPFHYIFTQFLKKPKYITPVADELQIQTKMEESTVAALGSSEKVKISGLSKRYDGASTKALSGVSLEFAKGEIFGLLGFNGAGKSTLINILVGVLSPSEGNINIFGMDASKDRFEIAAKTGICSQQDILYDALTTREHLYYFALMRGVPSSKIHAAIESIRQDLEMDAMMNSQSSVLSGGQKRKLCVALAFINEPELVVLDEMSSGVDPENRRVLWNFLFKRREGKAMLLCTHFMDEADVVCGRKALLTLGRLVSVGSSQFLKTVYNTGYTISIEKKTTDCNYATFRSWFEERKIATSCLKDNSSIVEIQLKASDIGVLKQFESSDSMKAACANYSIKENGLEAIFSSKELVDEDKLKSSPEEKEKLLHHMSSFVEPSFYEKTRYYFDFEMKRTAACILEIQFRMFVSIICLIILWVVIQSSFQSTTTVSSIAVPEMIARLVPPGVVLETNSDSLVAADSRFAKVGNIGSSLSMGTLLANGNAYSLNVSQGYPGASWLAVTNLVPSSGIQTTFEYIQVAKASGVSTSTGVVAALLLSQLYFDVFVALMDEILESKEKIKFLLLASGVPLSSYWIVTLARTYLLALPYIVLAPYVLGLANV
ncbi:hypothetical protein HDU91_001003 [Kappamyces sp. JEL0680]|nr:hypothetical protein HDU91_001003 [Kappamyces sp. JEL0680]